VLDLAGLRIQLPEELERLFREAAMKRFGYGRGSISQAAQEAIRKWLGAELQLEKSEFEGDPIKAIEGLLADVKIDSVKLQHLSGKIWVKKVLANVSS